jgi:hypothetical protein
MAKLTVANFKAKLFRLYEQARRVQASMRSGRPRSTEPSPSATNITNYTRRFHVLPMLRCFQHCLIPILRCWVLGLVASCSFCWAAHAQVASGAGAFTNANLGNCVQLIGLGGSPDNGGSINITLNGFPAIYAGGAIISDGLMLTSNPIGPSDLTQSCSITNVTNLSQTGASSPNDTATLSFTYTYQSTKYQFQGSASEAGTSYSIISLGPSVTSVSPISGTTAGGTSVTITGTNLTGATGVTIGGVAATNVVVASATQITATTPAGTAGAASVLVTTPGGTNAANTLFTYATPAPTVTAIAPNTGTPAGGTSVTITGTNLTGATAVRFGTSNASITANSATSITATAPAGTGTVDITVTTAGGTSTASATDHFTYIVPVPTVTSVSPNSGPTTGGTSVTITGTNLTGATAVKFGGNNATSFTVTSASQINAVAPAGSLGAVDVTVKTSSGLSAISSADQYTYAVPADSVNLRKLQAAVTPMVAQVWGQATSGAIESAVSEGFAGGGGKLISPSGNGVRINFSADPDDQEQANGDASRAFGRSASANPFSNAYGSFDSNARGITAPGGLRANDTTASRTDDAFTALGYAGPTKAPPLRPSEPREWLGWAEISGATLSRWSTSTALGMPGTNASIYGDQVDVIAGLTRVLTPNFLIGVLGGWETFDFRSDAIQGRLTGDGWTAGAYAGWKLSNAIRFDAGVAYSGIGFNGTAGTASGSFSGDRLLVTAGVKGNYATYGFLLEPSATIYALWEHENAYTDTLGTAEAARDFSTGRASAGLKVAYPFAWTSTVKLAPYAGIYGDYYFNADNISLAGAGALLTTPVFAGMSARTEAGFSAQFAGGGQFTAGAERSGLGGSFSLWTYRARASIPFGPQ